MRDSNVNVRAKAVWGLANLFNDTANVTDKELQGKGTGVAVEISNGQQGKDWVEPGGDDAIDVVDEQMRPALCVDNEIMLAVVEEAVNMAVHDSDKVQSNAVRLLGYLCVHLLPETDVAGNESVVKGGQENLGQLLSKLAHSLIRSVYPDGLQFGGTSQLSHHPAVKVQLNACSASGLLLRASR
jgi:hypothetical protein